MGIAISVVICTHNRSRLVDQVLATLADVRLAPARFEVIVVDNNSSDDTRSVVERHSRSRPNVGYHMERRTGLSNARNAGWRLARGPYVAYIDDDCKVPPEWLTRLATVIAVRCPAIVGGPALAFYDRPQPPWFRDEYGSYDLGGEPRALDRQFLHGMNITFERETIEALGGFNPAFGMSGGGIGYGEEVDLQRRLRALRPDAEIYYDPALFVYHLVRPEKMTMGWIIRQRFAKGAFSYRLFHGEDAAQAGYGKLARRSLLATAQLARSAIIGIPLRDRGIYPYPQNYLLDHAFVHLDMLGQLCEQFRQVSRRDGLRRRADARA